MRKSGAAFSHWNSIWSVWVLEAEDFRTNLEKKNKPYKSMCLWNLVDMLSDMFNSVYQFRQSLRHVFDSSGMTIAQLLDHYAEEPHLSDWLSRSAVSAVHLRDAEQWLVNRAQVTWVDIPTFDLWQLYCSFLKRSYPRPGVPLHSEHGLCSKGS